MGRPVEGAVPAEAGSTSSSMAQPPGPALTVRVRLLVLAAAALAFSTHFFPSPQLRVWLARLAGDPSMVGPGRVFCHLFLFSTLTALVSFAVWSLLAARGWLPRPREWFGPGPRPVATAVHGVIAGVALSAFFVGLVAAVSAAGVTTGLRVALSRFDGWDAVANLFSNFYEEIVYRGLMLLTIVRVSGRPWLGVILSSLVFGLVHTQYGIVMMSTVAIGGAAMAWVCLRTRSLWSAWAVHMLTDILVPLFIGIPGAR